MNLPFKKLTVLIVLLLPTSLSLAFTDVASTNPHKEAIEFLQQKGAIQGYTDNTFRPNSPINRAEFLKILLQAKSPGAALAQNQSNCFPDVAATWYSPYVCYAKSNGIIAGYPNGNFHPENNINLAEALKMVLETYEVDLDPTTYTDWYAPYYWTALSKGWLNQINQNITHAVTRGEMAELIWRLENESPRPYALPKQWVHSDHACNQNSFRMAFILLTNPGTSPSNNQLTFLNQVKNNFENDFNEATYGLARMKVDPLFIIEKTSAMFEEGLPVETEITKKFYETHPDNFDFISIYTTFEIGAAGKQWHNTIKNTIQGIGMEPSDNAALYGSKGRLRGTNMMRNIPENPSDARVSQSYALLHETGHQWCCYAGTSFTGQHTGQLEITEGTGHYVRGLNSPYPYGDPNNSDHWQPNGDGTYSRSSIPAGALVHYHPFTLYFMGLLPKDAYDIKYQIFNSGLPPNFNFTTATLYSDISVTDIINALGPRTCTN